MKLTFIYPTFSKLRYPLFLVLFVFLSVLNVSFAQQVDGADPSSMNFNPTCNIFGEITMENITLGGPVDSVGCQSGNQLLICFNIYNWYAQGRCLHSIIPDFGDCLNVYPDFITGEPGDYLNYINNLSFQGEWGWFEEGVVLYNDFGMDGYYPPYTPIGAGWSYFNHGANECPNPFDPNGSYGDCGSGPWEVCFYAEPTACIQPGEEFCEISFKTFSSGETGCSPMLTCPDDLPIVKQFTKRCCEPPVIENDTLSFTVCSGDQFTLDLLSNMDPETTWNWEVEPNPYGASPGSGTTISDLLTNNTGVPVMVTYYVTPTCALGCIGQTYEVQVTINPAPEVTLINQNEICEGDCVVIDAVVISNGGYTGCWWSNGQANVPTIIDCPQGSTFYSVTVTNSYGCTAEASTFVDVIPPVDVDIVASSLEVCENDAEYPITLTANAFGGYAPYSYQWSTGEVFESIEIYESGSYSVTVYDNYGGCYPGYSEISVTVNPTPVITVSGPDIICEGEEFCLEANPSGGTWGGNISIDGCGGSFPPLGPGVYTFLYDYVDNNGCIATVEHSIIVEEALTELEISCISTETSVEFFWNDINSATGYLVDGVFQTGTTFFVDGLDPGEIVSISVEAISSNSCLNTFADAVCITEECPYINLEIEPVSPQCQQTSDFVALQANIQGGTWIGDGIVDASAGLFDPQSASIGINTIQYYYESGSCTYVTFIEIEVDEALAEPDISCDASLEEVTFSWAPVDGAVAYLVNGVTQQATSFTISNLLPGEMAGISVEAVGQGACGSSFTQASCTTLDCPSIIVTITEVPNLCQTGSGVITLEVNEGLGVWAGPGIIDEQNGLFDPTAANLGINEIEYTLINGVCTYSESIEIEVEEALAIPEINCESTVDEVSFSWPSIVGASNYIVNGVAQQGTSITFNNLQPGETVNINVEAVGQGACGSSFAEASCNSEDCPVMSLSVSDVPALCQESSGIINLEASEMGGVWSGPGIIDSENGLFDPQAATIGLNEITYFLENGYCFYSASVEIEVEASLAIPVITCVPSIENVNFSWLPVNGASGYIVNGVAQQSTSYTVNNLQPGQAVDITIEAVGLGACGNSIAQVSCNAEDCPVINLELDPVADICTNEVNGDLISLNATISGGSGNGIGIWEGNGIVDPEAGLFDPVASGLVDGVNEVMFIYSEGVCSYSQSLLFNVFESPAIAAGESVSLTCTDPVLTLDGTGEGTPSWSGPGIISGANSFNAQINLPGIYYLTITNQFTGCSETSEVVVTEDIEAPIAIVNDDQWITCTETEAVLTSIGNTLPSYQAEWEGPGINGGNVNDWEIFTDQPGLYILRVVNTENGCISLPDTVVVLESVESPELEVITIGALDCSGSTVILETPYQLDYVYQWTAPDGSIFSTYNFETTLEGMYSLLVTNMMNGCSAQEDYLLESTTSAPASDAGEDQLINCNESVATLDGANSEVGTDIEYLWTGPAGGISGPANQLEVEAILEGYYKLRVTDLSTSCFSEDSVYVSANFEVPDAYAGLDQQISCNESVVTLTGTTSTTPALLTWIDASGQVIMNSAVLTTNESGWYYFSVLNTENGCLGIDSAFVSIDEDIPTSVEALYAGETCHGDADAYISILTVEGGTAPYQYSINGQSFSDVSSWHSLIPGTYEIEVMDANACAYSQNYVIPETHPLVLDMGPDIVIELGQSEQIDFHTNIANNAIDTIYWTTSEIFDCIDENCNDILISPLNSMTLEAVLIDTSGCMATAELNVKVKKKRFVFIPNTFTPNGDGINDVFYIQGLEKRIRKVNRFVVTDRWGAVVFEEQGFSVNDPGYGWDGFYKSKESGIGVYVYFAEVEFVDGYIAIFKGDVTLMR